MGYGESRQAFESFYGTSAEPLSSLGDEAFSISGVTSSIPTVTIGVRKGSSSASVQLMGVGEDVGALNNQGLALARILVEKL